MKDSFDEFRNHFLNLTIRSKILNLLRTKSLHMDLKLQNLKSLVNEIFNNIQTHEVWKNWKYFLSKLLVNDWFFELGKFAKKIFYIEWISKSGFYLRFSKNCKNLKLQKLSFQCTNRLQNSLSLKFIKKARRVDFKSWNFLSFPHLLVKLIDKKLRLHI